MTRTMGGYKVSEDGGAFKLPCFDRTSEDGMLEVKMFSTMYPEGYEGNFRCQYNTRFLSSDKLGHTVFVFTAGNYFADDLDLLHLSEARGGEPIMADALRQQGSSSL